MTTAIYARVSSKQQDTKSQEADLAAFAEREQSQGTPVRWYKEKATGTNFDRKEWEKLHKDILAGRVTKLVVWRLDRLGRLAGATISLLDELEAVGCRFLSLRDGFDPSTPSGRLMRNILASVAQYETEVRRERQAAGISAAKGTPGKYTGGKAGRRVTVTPEKERAALDLLANGKGVSEISRVVGLSRPTIYKLAKRPA